jgi:AcrR family transcriptional regulator
MMTSSGGAYVFAEKTAPIAELCNGPGTLSESADRVKVACSMWEEKLRKSAGAPKTISGQVSEDGGSLLPNGHEARSAETRSRMVAAAIEVFGRVGYEAASTRELAKQGKTNLSAIPYHFGGKRELYMAAAEVIADHARKLTEIIVVQLDDPSTGSPGYRLEEALQRFLHIMLDDSAPRSWTAYLVRCATEDDEAFHLIYDQALAPLHKSLVRVVRAIADSSIDEDEIRLRVSSTIAALISFRLLRGIVLRGMNWRDLRLRNAQRIETMVKDLVHRGFLSDERAVLKKRNKASSKGKKHS